MACMFQWLQRVVKVRKLVQPNSTRLDDRFHVREDFPKAKEEAARVVPNRFRENLKRVNNRDALIDKIDACTSPIRKEVKAATPTPKIVKQFEEKKMTVEVSCAATTTTAEIKKGSIINFVKDNKNQYSQSIIAPTKKNYLKEGSLFNSERDSVLVFGGTNPHANYGKGRNTGKDIYLYNPELNTWEFVGELPEPRHHHSVVFFRGKVYLAGGADPRNDDNRGVSVVVNTMWSYDPVSRAWFTEKNMLHHRKNFGFVVSSMKLYAIGGMDDDGTVLSSVEQFDPLSGTWTEVAPISSPRMGIACTKYRDHIWVAGGMTEAKEGRNKVTNVVELYNANKNEWNQLNDLRIPCGFAKMFTMNDKLHLIGGAGRIHDKDRGMCSIASIDIWNDKTKSWKLETEMTIARHGHTISHLGTQILIIGGMTTTYMRALSNVECFCCERGTWLKGLKDLPTKLSGHASLSLPPACIM